MGLSDSSQRNYKKYPLWDKGDKVTGESTWGQLERPRRGKAGHSSGAAAPKFLRGDHSLCWEQLLFVIDTCIHRHWREKDLFVNDSFWSFCKEITRKNGSYLQVQVISKMWCSSIKYVILLCFHHQALEGFKILENILKENYFFYWNVGPLYFQKLTQS